MTRNTLALVFVAAVAGCTTAQDGMPPTLTHAEVPRGCPLGVRGAQVWAEDTPDGVALTFVSPDRPAEMRVRAHDAAAQHAPGQRLGQGHNGKHGDGGDHGLQLMQAPVAYSVAADIESGARIYFVPIHAADRDALRLQLRERAARMSAATCP
jgi:hypothetical protein